MSSHQLSQHDTAVLRRLAARKAELAGHPLNLERKARWYRHDAGEDGLPMVLAEVGGVMSEVMPPSRFECEDEWARGLERGLRMELYQFEVLQDDHVIEPFMDTNWHIHTTGYGVTITKHYPENEGRLAARRWDSPIQDLDRDFDLLRPQEFSVDREATWAEVARMEEIFQGILPVRLRGEYWWSLGMTWTLAELIGLENLMLAMYDNPDGLHRIMQFLRDDHMAMIKWFEREGLLHLNNLNDYIGSGKVGYTHDLPQPDYKAGDPVRLRDRWMLSESQETVGVGPEQFEEFIFPYQLDLINCFGKSYYGCCEPLHSRLHILKRIPNLARVSVAPWADQQYMAQELGRDIVFSRKPNPTLISTTNFDEIAIRSDLVTTLAIAREAGCRIELIMKDVHTLCDEPQRLPRWVEIAQEVIDTMYQNTNIYESTKITRCCTVC